MYESPRWKLPYLDSGHGEIPKSAMSRILHAPYLYSGLGSDGVGPVEVDLGRRGTRGPVLVYRPRCRL